MDGRADIDTDERKVKPRRLTNGGIGGAIET